MPAESPGNSKSSSDSCILLVPVWCLMNVFSLVVSREIHFTIGIGKKQDLLLCRIQRGLNGNPQTAEAAGARNPNHTRILYLFFAFAVDFILLTVDQLQRVTFYSLNHTKWTTKNPNPQVLETIFVLRIHQVHLDCITVKQIVSPSKLPRQPQWAGSIGNVTFYGHGFLCACWEQGYSVLFSACARLGWVEREDCVSVTGS